jgi:hypothetical protein
MNGGVWMREATRKQAAEAARVSLASMLSTGFNERVKFLEQEVTRRYYFDEGLSHTDALRFCRQIECLIVEIEQAPTILGLDEVEREVWENGLFYESVRRMRKLEKFVLDNTAEPVWDDQ